MKSKDDVEVKLYVVSALFRNPSPVPLPSFITSIASRERKAEKKEKSRRSRVCKSKRVLGVVVAAQRNQPWLKTLHT